MTQLVNWEKLERVFQGHPEKLRELVGEYCQRAPELMRSIESAEEQGDLQTIEYRAHALKGNSSLLGAFEVEQRAFELYSAARQGDSENVSETLPLAREAVTSTVEDLKEYLG